MSLIKSTFFFHQKKDERNLGKDRHDEVSKGTSRSSILNRLQLKFRQLQGLTITKTPLSFVFHSYHFYFQVWVGPRPPKLYFFILCVGGTKGNVWLRRSQDRGKKFNWSNCLSFDESTGCTLLQYGSTRVLKRKNRKGVSSKPPPLVVKRYVHIYYILHHDFILSSHTHT